MGYFPQWPMNTLVELGSGDEVTICYSHLDGCGGAYGRHWFTEEQRSESDLPMPDVLFRPDGVVPRGHKPGMTVVAYEEIPVVEWGTGDDGEQLRASGVWYPEERVEQGRE